MPRILILRLEAPLVAFGDIMVDARGPVSDLPSASMLTGLIGNALGLRRDDVSALQRLQDRLVHAARLDRSAGRFTEYQTAKLYQDDRAWTSRGRRFERESSPSYSTDEDGRKSLINQRYRDHDADVCAHVALLLDPADEAPDLDAVATALDTPFRPLFIGRKPCLPATRIVVGLVEADTLIAALTACPLAPSREKTSRPVLVDLPLGETPPEGFRRIHRSDRRDWRAGIHTGDSRRWMGCVPRDAFAAGDAS